MPFMSTRRTAWHYFLGLLLAEKAPRCFEVIAESPVTLAVQHMDWLFLRRRPWSGPPDRGETLVELWPRLPVFTIGEYKSASRRYRRGEVHRLLGYAHQYASEHVAEVGPGDLAIALLVASRNEALDDDLRLLGATERALGGGYIRIEGLAFPMLLIELAEVADHDRDDYIALFTPGAPVPIEARAWWYAHHGLRTEDGMDPRQMDEFKAMQRRYFESVSIEERLAGIDPQERLAGLAPEQRLAGLAPEQRLAGLAPEQRLAGLAPEQRLAGLAPAEIAQALKPEQRLAGLSEAEAVLALPDSVLAGLTDAFIAALPADVRDRVRARLAATTVQR